MTSLVGLSASKYAKKEAEKAIWTPKDKDRFLAHIEIGLEDRKLIPIYMENQSEKLLKRLAAYVKMAFPHTSVLWKVDERRWTLDSPTSAKLLKISTPERGTYIPKAPQIHLTSMTLSPPKEEIFHASTLISIFEEVILTLASYSTHIPLHQLEWRANIEYYRKDALDEILKILKEKGFQVDFKPPYMMVNITIQDGSMAKKVVVHHHIAVSIPENTTSMSLPKNRREVCASNYLRLREKLPPRAMVSPREMEPRMEKIESDLEFLAEQKPFLRNYACNIWGLSSNDASLLLEKVKALGYDASIEAPFLTRRGEISLFATDYITQNLMIRLPEG